MNKITKYLINPVPKPRMTQSDKWQKRPIVEAYWVFKADCQKLNMKLPESGTHIVFHIPMSPSWSDKKKKQMDRQPHKQTPDLDNLIKALFDALFENDSHIWNYQATKFWAYEGSIIIIEET